MGQYSNSTEHIVRFDNEQGRPALYVYWGLDGVNAYVTAWADPWGDHSVKRPVWRGIDTPASHTHNVRVMAGHVARLSAAAKGMGYAKKQIM